ncbi:MAG: metal-sensing transcriptional repressor, partial [Candidatus Nitrosopolaris sp.]
HVRGVQRMVNEDKSYADIVQQISAVRAALDGVVEVMVQDLVERYVSQSGNEKGKQVAIELKDTVLIFFSISEDVLIYCLSRS